VTAQHCRLRPVTRARTAAEAEGTARLSQVQNHVRLPSRSLLKVMGDRHDRILSPSRRDRAPSQQLASGLRHHHVESTRRIAGAFPLVEGAVLKYEKYRCRERPGQAGVMRLNHEPAAHHYQLTMFDDFNSLPRLAALHPSRKGSDCDWHTNVYCKRCRLALDNRLGEQDVTIDVRPAAKGGLEGCREAKLGDAIAAATAPAQGNDDIAARVFWTELWLSPATPSEVDVVSDAVPKLDDRRGLVVAPNQSMMRGAIARRPSC